MLSHTLCTPILYAAARLLLIRSQLIENQISWMCAWSKTRQDADTRAGKTHQMNVLQDVVLRQLKALVPQQPIIVYRVGTPASLIFCHLLFSSFICI